MKLAKRLILFAIVLSFSLAIFGTLIINSSIAIPTIYQSDSVTYVHNNSNLEFLKIENITSFSKFSETNKSPLIQLLTHNLEVKLQPDGSSRVISTFAVTNNDSQPISYFMLELNETISSVYAFDPIGSLPFTWTVLEGNNNLINVTLRYPLLEENIYVFSVSYEKENVLFHIQEPTEYYEFGFEVFHYYPSDQFNLEVVLPVGGKLLEDETQKSVAPTPNKIFTEDSLVKVRWVISDVEQDVEDYFLIRFQIASNCLLQEESGSPVLYIILAFFGGLLIGGVGTFFVYKKLRQSGETELVSSLLSKSERSIIKAINADNGISTQKRICEKTGFSKSKVSQILSKLEEKGVLERERWGRTNKVTLIESTFQELGVDSTSEKGLEEKN